MVLHTAYIDVPSNSPHPSQVTKGH